MIARLKGTLQKKVADHVIVDVAGVGYLVHIPFSTYYELGDEGTDVVLTIHTHVTENSLSLYGFWTDREKQLFYQLVQISGIGPKLAVTILSGLATDDLLVAIAAADIVRLTKIPGIGKKTAERIALEMKDRVQSILPEAGAEMHAPAAGWLQNDVVSALVNLGYAKNVAERAVDAVETDSEEAFESLLKKALRQIAG